MDGNCLISHDGFIAPVRGETGSVGSEPCEERFEDRDRVFFRGYRMIGLSAGGVVIVWKEFSLSTSRY